MRPIAFIGNYLPRQCGIATFTTDLCESIAAGYPEVNFLAVVVNDIEEGYDYPARVRFELQQDDLISYRRAADFLNTSDVGLICLQHEYGIFGGPAGSYILELLRELRMPIVTTLHTVLREPQADQRRVLEEVVNLSDRVVVMSQRGARFLQEVYRTPAEKIALIPHGIPDVPFMDSSYYKERFGVEDRQVLLTFGLLSPNKGIEYVIEALPAILSQHPNVVYLVLGSTHPHIKRRDGEAYRHALQELARARGVEEAVRFYDRFAALDELVQFISATDIYITPYLNPAQITSGALAYTVGAGKVVISTPYWYAEELLTGGRGLLTPFRDPEAIADAVLYVLNHEDERNAIRKRAYRYGREMIWPNVAHRYMELFERTRAERAQRPRPVAPAARLEHRSSELPALNLDHLHRMTDDTGILQHATFNVPNYSEGYTTDDNARALITAVLLDEVEPDAAEAAGMLAARYLAFLWHAFNPERGRFRNFMSYDRRWLEEAGSEDSHARALWALGTVLRRSMHADLQGVALRLFNLALPAVRAFVYPRPWALSLLGMREYLKRYPEDRATRQLQEMLAERLWGLYRHHSSSDWRWFEDKLLYDNARLPHALLLAGVEMGRNDMHKAGLESLAWLMEFQRSDEGHFVPIGCRGWYVRNGERARFDQQPIEAQASISACLAAYRITGDPRWREEAWRAFDWFVGRNDLGLPLYDAATGGCRDGLHAARLNQNQGAESTLAFLMSLLEMYRVESTLSRPSPNSTASELKPFGERQRSGVSPSPLQRPDGRSRLS